eukprot:scaffold30508_cov119-Isochrysis_galbana.AAC.2
MSDWRMVPECMHTALQSSNWPDPASKNISCDLWSRSIMCCVLRSESFFSCSNCWAMRNLASERARFTLETPSSIVMAKRCIVSMSSACSMMPPKALTCALKLNVASFLMSTLEMLPRVEVFRLMTCDGQRRSPSGSSGCVDSMKTSKASPTTTAYRSVHEASNSLAPVLGIRFELKKPDRGVIEPIACALRRDILDKCLPAAPPPAPKPLDAAPPGRFVIDSSGRSKEVLRIPDAPCRVATFRVARWYASEHALLLLLIVRVLNNHVRAVRHGVVILRLDAVLAVKLQQLLNIAFGVRLLHRLHRRFGILAAFLGQLDCPGLPPFLHTLVLGATPDPARISMLESGSRGRLCTHRHSVDAHGVAPAAQAAGIPLLLLTPIALLHGLAPFADLVLPLFFDARLLRFCCRDLQGLELAPGGHAARTGLDDKDCLRAPLPLVSPVHAAR